MMAGSMFRSRTKEKEYIDKEIAGLIYKNDKLKKLFGEKIFYKSIRYL